MQVLSASGTKIRLTTTMSSSIAHLLEFLQVVFTGEMDLWSSSSTDEEVVRAVAREYTRSRQEALLAELESVLASDVADDQLQEIAARARVTHVVDAANLR